MSNYQQLTEAELRNYVKQHPDDEDAFHDTSAKQLPNLYR